MAFGNRGGGGRQYGNSGDGDRGGQGERRPGAPWTDHARAALTALLKLDRLNGQTRELLEKFSNNRTPSNNMVCTVYQIYCEKFHRPTRDYTIKAWQPDDEPQSREPQQQAQADPPAEQEAPQQAPRRQGTGPATGRKPPAKPEPEGGFGKDRWGDGGEDTGGEAGGE